MSSGERSCRKYGRCKRSDGDQLSCDVNCPEYEWDRQTIFDSIHRCPKCQSQNVTIDVSGKFVACLACHYHKIIMARAGEPTHTYELKRQKDERRVPKCKTFRRDNPKTSRNDPCPCGSGKKYKKCCERENNND